MQDLLKATRRCKIIWKTMIPLLGPIFSKLFDYRGTKYVPETSEPYLLVSNHTYAADPGFLIVTVKDYFRFVSSDHVVENPFVRALIMGLANPIVNHHEQSQDVVYNEMLESLKSGINVQLMAEARTTDIGSTGYISRRNATLVKEAGCGLITFHLKGGYLMSPRWAAERRKGPVLGEVVHHYSAAEIAQMSEEEVYETMCRDLYVNAYEENRKLHHKYLAEHPAEHAEYVLYGCPKCGSVGHVHTKDDRLFCDDCGFVATVDDEGFWHGEGLPFDNIPDWDAYQKELIYKMIDEAEDPDEVLVSHDHQLVYTMDSQNDVHLKDEHGTLKLYKRAIELDCCGKQLRLAPEDIHSISYASVGTLIIVTDEEHFRIKTGVPRAANIYVVAERYMKGKKSI